MKVSLLPNYNFKKMNQTENDTLVLSIEIQNAHISELTRAFP
jgi:hypothetical protein